MTARASLSDAERAFTEYRNLYGRLLGARFRGEKVDFALARHLREAWVDHRQAVLDSSTSSEDRRLLGLMTATVRDLDEWMPLEGTEADMDLRRRIVSDFAMAGAGVELGGETLDRLTLLGRLETESDPPTRRSAFLAMAPIWESVDGDGDVDSPYRRLLPLSVAAWSGAGSPLQNGARRLGLDPNRIEADLETVLEAFRLHLPSGPIEPWDYRFLCGAAERMVTVPLESLEQHNERHLVSLGAPHWPRVRYEIKAGPGRPPLALAFTLAEQIRYLDGEELREAIPVVFASYATGGLGNLSELIHESGHAIHYLATRTRPAEFDWPADSLPFVEAVGELLAWNMVEPAYVAEHFGAAISDSDSRLYRYGPLMLDFLWTLFEVELHRHPDRRPNDVWAELAETHLGIVGHPEWSWWAVRGQLVETPGYLSNYALGGIVVAALRRRMAERRPGWFMGDPLWYGFASEHLLRFGATRTSGEIISAFLGDRLSAAAILSDLDG